MADKKLCENIIFAEKLHDIDLYLPGFSVNCTILAFHDGYLKVLLNKVENFDKWMLPTGFIYKHESSCDTAARIINNRTGLKKSYFKQFSVFADAEKPNFEDNEKLAESLKLPPKIKEWYLNRFVTVGYFSLVQYDKVKLFSNRTGDLAEWFKIDELPDLYRDHKKVIDKAFKTIRQQVGYIPLGYELLPKKFTMPELRTVYEIVTGVEIDRRNFQRKMLSLDSIERLDESRKSGAHKAPILYSFIKKKFEESLKNGSLIADLKVLIS